MTTPVNPPALPDGTVEHTRLCEDAEEFLGDPCNCRAETRARKQGEKWIEWAADVLGEAEWSKGYEPAISRLLELAYELEAGQ